MSIQSRGYAFLVRGRAGGIQTGMKIAVTLPVDYSIVIAGLGVIWPVGPGLTAPCRGRRSAPWPAEAICPVGTKAFRNSGYRIRRGRFVFSTVACQEVDNKRHLIPKALLVLGCMRSGTSMDAQIAKLRDSFVCSLLPQTNPVLAISAISNRVNQNATYGLKTTESLNFEPIRTIARRSQPKTRDCWFF